MGLYPTRLRAGRRLACSHINKKCSRGIMKVGRRLPRLKLDVNNIKLSKKKSRPHKPSSTSPPSPLPPTKASPDNISATMQQISTSQQDSNCFNEFLGPIKSMEPNAQLELWKTMLENHPFDLCQLTSLRTAIDERIKLDIISGVPYEIALYIMSFLSPQDLCQAAQTCKSWRTVCEDNRLWREKCKEERLLDEKQTLDILFKDRIAKTHEKQEKFLIETLPPPTPSNNTNWKFAYMKHMDILRNWRTRKFEISESFRAPTPMQVEQQQPLVHVEPLNKLSSSNRSEPYPSATPSRNPARHAGNMSSGTNDLQTRSRRSLRLSGASASGDNNSSINSSADNNHEGPNDSNNTGGDTKPFFESINQQTIANNYLRQLRCHEDSVITCLQYNPITNTIVSGSDDQTLKVWSSETGRCITTLEGHTGGVWSSQLSPDDTVISGSTDRTLKVWKAHTGKLMHTLFGHTSTVRCLALDGNHVVSGSRDTTLRLWDIVKGRCKHVFHGHTAAVRCVEYKDDIIVSGAYDNLVMVWDAKTSQALHALECHMNRIYSLQFDGKTIASGSLDSMICIWDASTGKLRHQLEGHTSLTSKMQLKGNLLVSANADTYCKVWDINTGECLQTLGGQHKHQSAITSVYFNNRHVVTSSDDGTVKLWDIRNGKFIRDLIVLPTASKGGVVWRIRASYTKLICAVGSRTETEDTHLLILDFANA